MKNVYKFLIVMFSVVFISSGVLAQMNNAAGKQKFNEDQMKVLAKSGFTERSLDTKIGFEKACEIIKTYEENMMVPTIKKPSFSSKPIKGAESLVTVTVGTESNITTQYVTDITPFGTYYEDGQNQLLFTSSELGIAGIGAGEITEIGWHVAEADPAAMNGFNIEIKHSSAFTVTEFETDFTNVYSGTYTADTGWNMFTFTEPFLYDGASSLLVKVCFDNPEYTGNSYIYYSNTPEPMNGWAYNDGTAGCTDPYEGNTVGRPNTRFTGEEMLNPPPGIPFNEMPISGSEIVPINGDLTWTFGNNSDTYELWFGPAGNMEMVVDNEAVTSPDGIYSYSDLNYASGYQWQVIAMNANGMTYGPVWSFATACGLVVPPFFEDFSSYTGAAPPPSCWLEAGDGTPFEGPIDIGSSLWVSDNFGNIVGSSNCAKVNMYSSSKREWLITPNVDLSGGGNNAAMFDIAVTNWNGTDPISMGSDDQMIFLISPDAGTSWDTLAMWDVTTPVSNEGESVLIPLSGYTQSDVIFAFWANEGEINDIEDYDFFLDNFAVVDASYGSLEGIVSDLATGNPIEGAEVKVGYQTYITDASGMYSFAEVLVGSQFITCTAYGHNDTIFETIIIEGETTTEDIAMTAPTMDISPPEVNVVVDPFGTLTEYIDIANNGNGELMWTAVLDTTGSGNDSWLTVIQFEGTVEAGETGQIQLDFDANTIVAGTVLNGTISFASDPEVGEVDVPITFSVGDLAFANIQGNVLLDGIAPYNIGDVTQVVIEAGPYSTNPDSNGDYDLEIYPGTFDLMASLYGYTQQSMPGFVVEEGMIYTGIDFTMPCIYGKLYGNVTDIDTGDPIENAQITAFDSPILGITDEEGNYEVFIEAGIYSLQADHATYAPEVVQDVDIVSASETEQDFALTYQCVFCEASGGGTEHITGVEFGSISNLNNGYNTGYEDFTSMSTIVIPGLSYDLTINIDPVYTSDDYGVWIDWNFDCTFDPATENVLCEPDAGAASNTWVINIPPDAQPGVATMRVRMKWSGSDCGDPCGSTSYGEVEDYSIIITPGTYGSLSGIVSELSTSVPIEGAIVNFAGFYQDTTLADGSYYFEEVIAGTWDLKTTKVGFNDLTFPVTIEEGLLTEQNVEMTAPTMDITPAEVTVVVDPFGMQTEFIDIANNGNGQLLWTAVMDTTGSGNDAWLTITQFEGTVEAGETGQMQLDFDANTIIAGTVLNGIISFSSDPAVGEVTVPITLSVGDLAFGHIQGNVFLDGIAPYNIGDVTEVLLEAGPYYTSPDANGDYDITVYPGTYDVTVTLYGYTQQVSTGFLVEEGIIYTDIDFTMPCILGKLYGMVTDIDTGDPILNATITPFDSPIIGFTDAEGNYEIFVEAGTYDVQADHPTYAVEVAMGVAIDVQMDTEQDFALTYQCVFCEASGGGLEHITGVEFGNISNLNNGYNTGYEDFTSMSTLVIPGFSYDITINIDPVYTSDDYAVWIDWNFDCTFDPETENVLCEINAGAATNTWSIAIPPNAQPGVATMRVRMKWSGSDCGDPCGSTSYGEVEDYSIIITPGTYGSLSGFVTELSTGNPIEGAVVDVAGFYQETTLADGSYYFDEVITGTWDLTSSKDGYNQITESVTIEEDVLTEHNLQMTAPILEFSPDAIAITLEPNQQSLEPIVISNTGNGPVDWTANLSLASDNSDEIGDIVYELAVGNITGETQTFGSEWDGIYLWTTGGASYMDPNQLYQFDYDGNLVGQFDQPLDGSSSGIRDLAFDGTYLYGGNEVAFYQIDPADGSITMLFENNFGQTITALAWVPVFNLFYSKNLGSDLITFDMDGTLMESIPVSGAENVTGAAWDDTNNKLWLFNQSGSPQSTFMEYDIVANELTGTTQQVETIGGSGSQVSTGAFYATDMVPGFAVLGGSTQGSPNMAFAMDMGSSAAWIGIDLQSGSIAAGEDVTMNVSIDATDLLPAVYEAEIVFTSDPYLGETSVPIQLTVEGLIPPVGLFAYFTCTDVHLTWDNAGGTPDNYNIYRDNVLLTSVTTLEYTDMLVDPLVELCYTVTAVYGSEESQPTAASCLTVPFPENINISYIDGWGSSDTAYIVWDEPEACVMADEFNVYRDGELIGSTPDTVYYDTGLASNFYQYYVTAVYYFGESEDSDIVPILITSFVENKLNGLVVSPNPAIDYVIVNSHILIESYSILDINGKLVESTIVESSNFRINMSHYSEGVYYLRFETDEKPFLRKIIIK